MNKKIGDLIKGMEISHSELMSIFKCANNGGMRRSHQTNSLVLITDLFSDKNNPYKDMTKDGIIHYTGMGQRGDQSFDFMQNKTLYHSN